MNRVRRLRLLGLILLCDAVAFVGLLLFGLLTSSISGDRMYYFFVFACIIPLGVGWLIAAAHLVLQEHSPDRRTAGWRLLGFGGPFGPGLYLFRLGDGS
jgi:hypothetical protein